MILCDYKNSSFIQLFMICLQVGTWEFGLEILAFAGIDDT